MITAETTTSLISALTWLLDDISDAGEASNPETGQEYDSVALARLVLQQALKERG